MVKNIPCFLGRGVFSKKELFKGQFICEYSGELLTGSEAATKEETRLNEDNFMFYFSFGGCQYW